MKVSEFRKLIREEVRKAIKEGVAKYKVGQMVIDPNEEQFKILEVYPNKQAALTDLKTKISIKAYQNVMADVAKISKEANKPESDQGYTGLTPADMEKPWYVLRSTTEGSEYNKYPYILPELYVDSI